MNARQLFSSPKALAATALLALAGTAQAGGVNWTIGVDAPIIQGPGRVQAVVSNGRYYAPQPVVYVQQPPVYYAPRPMPVVYEAPREPRCEPRFLGWGHRWHRHEERAYRRGYERGYDQGRDDDRDDRRGGWDRHHH